ncbi:tRNA pseudouridine(55) synthase TruB [Lacticaseibacillus camelliae]|uniref:tRNA pseudouridine synthase B n=1 Tax=Lacticaseibacillus camelliae DSM 22697 = JCM 13995 TaxID=1423730 RepID=A0A0R2F410_9LACO|nr:tRNA pseudouridine(55) synthase TruB [Lacticaseibacillus camelliae]KRN22235.1 tRNA pseudouridine synthase B [Lacticaseibacillus camelliae DSM 22697 = JCM 13995]
MDGILPVYKPTGMTSADVVSKLRYLLQMKKVGHSGTLDPSVDGVLPIALGAATKAVPALMALGKTYIGKATLGFATETEDLDGAEVARVKLTAPFTDEQIDQALVTLTGDITQTPPMYSAVKVNGRKLYQYARNGQTVERPTRQVHVYAFKRTGPSRFDAVTGTQDFPFEAQVSKGTYIRTLAVDVGRALGVPAVMAQLTRIQSGGFKLEDTLDLRELTRETAPAAAQAHLRPIEFAFPHLPLVALSASQWDGVRNGRGLPLSVAVADEIGLTYEGVFKALYQKEAAEYRPALMFLANEGIG